MGTEPTLADRLGVTTHASPLRFKLERLRIRFPRESAPTLEDWLLDVAIARGVTVVSRAAPGGAANWPGAPPPDVLSNAELVVAICQPHNRDRPQWLRAAAQLVTRGEVDVGELELVARRELADRVLAEIARQALRSDPTHRAWQRLAALDHGQPPLRDTLVHWTRLAEPVMRPGQPGAAGWKLVG